MGKLLLLSSLIFVFNISLIADNTGLFQLDKNFITEKFKELNQIESFINQHDGITLSEMQASKNHLLAKLNLLDVSEINNQLGFADKPPLGIPSFVWGCCLGPVGVAIVVVVCDDNHERGRVVAGCIVSVVVYCIGGLVAYVMGY